jgi:hypothetical protein
MMEFAKWVIIVHAAGTLVVAIVVLLVALYFVTRWLTRRNSPPNANDPRAEASQEHAPAAERGA